MYHVFAWNYHEAAGGLNEYKGSYKTIEEIKRSPPSFSYIHIVKEVDGKLVLVGEGYGENENNDPPVIPAPKEWDWGEFIVKWELA